MKHTDPIARAFIPQHMANVINAHLSRAKVDLEFTEQLFSQVLLAMFTVVERFGYLRFPDGWGILELKHYKPHPRAVRGNVYDVPAIKKVRFKMGRKLMNKLNGDVSAKLKKPQSDESEENNG